MRGSAVRGGVTGALLLAWALAAGACGSPSHRAGPPGSSSSTTAAAVTTTTTPSTTSSGGDGSAASSGAGPPAADWPTYDHDAARSGVSTSTPAFDGKLDRSWTLAVRGDVYAQPLV